MPYFKVPVRMSVVGYRYVEADDKEESQLKAIDGCDNTLPAMRDWEEDGDAEAADLDEIEEIDFDTYEENSSDI